LVQQSDLAKYSALSAKSKKNILDFLLKSQSSFLDKKTLKNLPDRLNIFMDYLFIFVFYIFNSNLIENSNLKAVPTSNSPKLGTNKASGWFAGFSSLFYALSEL
jgi:hypothetical protein